jgi:hypothetical protein
VNGKGGIERREIVRRGSGSGSGIRFWRERRGSWISVVGEWEAGDGRGRVRASMNCIDILTHINGI